MSKIDINDKNGKQLTNYEGKFYYAFVFLFVLLIAIDQITKTQAASVFHNSVFAFSLPLAQWLIYFIYAIVIAGIFIYCLKNYKTFSRIQTLAWILIFAGAASNIGERITLGYVRDWIYILNGVFNLADGYIVLGIVLLLFYNSNDKNEQKLKK